MNIILKPIPTKIQQGDIQYSSLIDLVAFMLQQIYIWLIDH